MPICLLHAVCRHINNEHIIMGLLEFNKLPINTLVGADWRTFKAITGGREIDAAYTGKYRLTKAVCRLLSTLAPLQDKRYEKLLANLNQPVRVLNQNDPYEGIARGINAGGELLVERADGNIEEVNSGEVSVRGLYSYV